MTEVHLIDGVHDYIVEQTDYDGLLVTPWSALSEEQKQLIYKEKSEQTYA